VQRNGGTINNGEAGQVSDKLDATDGMLMSSGLLHEQLDLHIIGSIFDIPPFAPLVDDYDADLQIDQSIIFSQAPVSGRTRSSSRVAGVPNINSPSPVVDSGVSQIRVPSGIRVENTTGGQAKPATSIVPPHPAWG